jgi:DNA-binding NarL/FixJ family response regulator
VRWNLVVSEATVNRHVGNIFAKLGFAPGDDRNRRVLATLTYLRDGAQLNRP